MLNTFDKFIWGRHPGDDYFHTLMCNLCVNKVHSYDIISTGYQYKVVLEPLVSPDLAIYIFKQVKVKMTLDLVMSPWSMSNMKLLIVYLWFKLL